MSNKTERKARRMEVRKELGLRPLRPEEPTSRPRGPHYLIAHACFTCRRSFKVAPDPETRERICPICAGRMHQMGRSFHAPTATNLEQWAKVQALFAYGFRFFSYRSHGGPPLPKRYHEVAQFVEDNPKHPLRIAETDVSLLPSVSR